MEELQRLLDSYQLRMGWSHRSVTKILLDYIDYAKMGTPDSLECMPFGQYLESRAQEEESLYQSIREALDE